MQSLEIFEFLILWFREPVSLLSMKFMTFPQSIASLEIPLSIVNSSECFPVILVYIVLYIK